MKSNIKYATKKDLQKVNDRMDTMCGYNRKVFGFEKKLEALLIQQTMLKNDIKALNIRLNKIRKMVIKK